MKNKEVPNTREIIIGCMSWGAWGKRLSISEQAQLINFSVEAGNNSFDHADIYGDYTTEAEFGKALRDSGVAADSIRIITKCGIQYVGKSRSNKVKHYDYSKEYIVQSAEASLRNLGIQSIDTFLLHRPSPLMHPDEIAEAVEKLKIEGKIKHFGVSNFLPSQVAMLSTAVEVEVNQVEYSLTRPQVMYDGTLDQAIEKGIRVMSWSPLGSIFKEETEQSHRILPVLHDLSKKYDTSPDVILLAWIQKHPAAVSPVIGTTNPDRIKKANLSFKVDLEVEDWFKLLEVSQGRKVP
jgi:predicted oxidoreductase